MEPRCTRGDVHAGATRRDGGRVHYSAISGPAEYAGAAPSRDDGGPVTVLLDARLDNGRRVWLVHHVSPGPCMLGSSTFETRAAVQ